MVGGRLTGYTLDINEWTDGRTASGEWVPNTNTNEPTRGFVVGGFLIRSLIFLVIVIISGHWLNFDYYLQLLQCTRRRDNAMQGDPVFWGVCDLCNLCKTKSIYHAVLPHTCWWIGSSALETLKFKLRTEYYWCLITYVRAADHRRRTVMDVFIKAPQRLKGPNWLDSSNLIIDLFLWVLLTNPYSCIRIMLSYTYPGSGSFSWSTWSTADHLVREINQSMIWSQ